MKTALVNRLNSTIPSPTKPGTMWFNGSVNAVCSDCGTLKPVIYAFSLNKKWVAVLCGDCQAQVA
jgi:hypothetical protein